MAARQLAGSEVDAHDLSAIGSAGTPDLLQVGSLVLQAPRALVSHYCYVVSTLIPGDFFEFVPQKQAKDAFHLQFPLGFSAFRHARHSMCLLYLLQM